MVLPSKTQQRNKKLAGEVRPVYREVHQGPAQPKKGASIASTPGWEEYEYHLERIRWHCQKAGEIERALRSKNLKKVKQLKAYWLKE